MQLTINVKDSVVDKVLYLLENLQSDVQIVSKTQSNFDEISQKELKSLKKMSDEYKSGKHDEFEEYVV
jgi:hypothetical protein